MAINLDHVTEQITVTDDAANASLTVQSKGTGAINLAPGSSGVNISNGGTVTAITRTATGSAYTTIPSVALSAPTTAGGVQATASVGSMVNLGGTVQVGGTGYTNGDVLTVVGGTPTGVAATLTVTGVSGGAVTTVSAANFGQYTVLPTNPVSVTGGTGSSATLNLSWGIGSAVGFNITNAGSGYVEQPTVTFSGGGGSGAAAYATVGSGTTLRSLGSVIDFAMPSGVNFRVGDAGATAAQYWQAIGGAFTGILRSTGATQNGLIQTGGTGGISLQTNNGAQTQMVVSHTASAVNFVQVTGGATGTPARISAQGSDGLVSLGISSKGAGDIFFQNSGGGATGFIIRQGSGSIVNYLQATSAATGADPVLSAQGSDTNIDLVLQPKGTGALQAQQTDSTATGGNARGANAVDWQTSRGSAIQVASAQLAVLAGGTNNQVNGALSVVSGGGFNAAAGQYSVISGGAANNTGQYGAGIVAGQGNAALGWFNFIGGGFTNSATSGTAVTTQATTTVTGGSTAVTLSGSNASIRVGQLISGTGINTPTYVAAISGTSLTLSQNATATGTPTLSFFTPHGVVVGGGNNQATGSYSFIGGGGDAGTAANRNVASGDWSTVAGGRGNIASGIASFVGNGGVAAQFTFGNTASGDVSAVVNGLANVASGSRSFIGSGTDNTANSLNSVVVGGTRGTSRSVIGNQVFSAHNNPVAAANGASQAALLILGTQTTDATPTVLRSDTAAASTTNQVILPNNSAYYFRGTVIANVTGGGNTKSWTIEGAIKRGANAASTTLVGVTVTSPFGDAGAATWTIAAAADTTNGGLAVTFTGQAGTTIRVVAKIETTEMTF